ncbi:MAG: NAD-dependent deacylase [Deltaproteobacteria bacterium]|nr:NAD-dependent deacylase [Deltaproteobacteria bacterium]
MDLALIEKAADLLVRAKHTIVLTGAGISTESGVPDFRSPGGIWDRYDPSVFLYQRFLKEPDSVWKIIIEMVSTGALSIFDAKPNKGHIALAYLEQIGLIHTVITQNIDNLHQKAGSRHVIEFHGNMQYAKCIKCSRLYDYQEIINILDIENLPPKCTCGGVLKPNAVFFGETIPKNALTEAFEEAGACDLMLVIGTSAQVEPAASLPFVAKGKKPMALGLLSMFSPQEAAYVVEMNRETTPLTDSVSDFIIQGSTGEILTELTEKVKEIKGLL